MTIQTQPLSINEIQKAADIIKAGGLVAFPTETVYGLGANALDEAAVKKIYAAKGRPSDNPLILHVLDIDGLSSCVEAVPQTALKLIAKFCPGPITMILNKSKNVPYATTGNRDTVAVRIPAHEVARRLIELAGVPIAAPSANTSGRLSPTTAAHVLADMHGRIDAVLCGDACSVGIESTIIDLSSGLPILLRPGTITKTQIESVLGVKINQSAATLADSVAPGMKYKHYAPDAPMYIIRGEPHKVAEYINRRISESGLPAERVGILTSEESAGFYTCGHVINVGSIKNLEDVARGIYAALHRFNEAGVEIIFSESFRHTEVGLSIMNRLEKAAGNNIIDI
ncbi:MAG: L-threonylcarbamoyladenylate synthase [Defluviitaleaceae bacterium]|nr:L-threonylcarbamoyladenylate synthase [Defluviitaleaceae bacterium]